MKNFIIILIFFVFITTQTSTFAADINSTTGAKKVNVNKIKEEYWQRGENVELDVIQNRRYTKSSKFELSGFGGFVISDSFLSVTNYGASLSFHLSEYFALSALYWKDRVSASPALKTFEEINGFTVNTNAPKSFLAGELSFNPIYGKISLMGSSIVYFDLHLLGGFGVRDTESGKFSTLFWGIGQQIYLSKYLSLKLDYRMLFFKENLIEKVLPSSLGQVVGSRSVVNSAITIGLSIML